MSAPASTSEGGDVGAAPVGKNKRFRKDKPWDHDGIDHWNIPKFEKEDNPTGMLEESSFAVLFPKYREKYLREAWPIVTRGLKECGIRCELNLVEGSMSVLGTVRGVQCPRPGAKRMVHLNPGLLQPFAGTRSGFLRRRSTVPDRCLCGDQNGLA